MTFKCIASRSACLASLLLPCIMMPLTGCGGASAASSMPATAEQAKTMLTATLDAWKSGEAYSGHLAANAAMQVADEDWLGGAKLESFALGEDSASEVSGPSRRWPVVLKLRTSQGKISTRRAVYQITAEPHSAVIRQD